MGLMNTTPPKTLRALCFAVFVFLLAPAPPACAAMTRIEIEKRIPFAEGRAFEGIGPYERLIGRVHFAVDPAHERNSGIIDLELAPRNRDGLVEFSADLEILAPVDLKNASGTLLYDVNNRGRRMCLNLFNGGADHFLMRQGCIVVWSGWLADALPGDDPGTAEGRALRLDAPVATEKGRRITGQVRGEVVVDQPAARASLSNREYVGSYRPVDESLERATLTWRLREDDPRVSIPHDQWRLEVREIDSARYKHVLPMVELAVSGSLQPGYIYELIYEARDPVVQGLGLAGIRDLVSFLKHDASEKNPLRLSGERSAAERTIGFGISQSGRCLRVLLYEGLNADEEGRRVFDGLIPHVAGGGLGFFNYRFAEPSRYNSQHTDHLFPCDMFPFAYETQRDPLSGREDGILRRARADGVVPKVFHTQASAEYWDRSGSLAHTDPLGRRDAKPPDEVRIYAIGGAQHGPGNDVPGEATDGQLPDNPTDYRPVLRALFVAMEAWLRDGTPPPESRYPRIADGTLVGWRAEESGWNPLPGVRYPEVIQQPELLDYGPEFSTKARITVNPPRRQESYPVLVPAYGEDNNERGMLRLPSIEVPVATYTGWMLRSRQIGAQSEQLQLKGSYIPLRRTRADRRAAGDPRPALLERYRDFDDYLSRFETAARRLVKERYLLEEDVERLCERARRNEPLFIERAESP